MGQRTLKYSIVFSLLILSFFTLSVQAQQARPNPTPKRDQKKKEKETAKEVVPLYNGTFVGVDIFGPGSKLLGGDFFSSEISVVVNLKNKFLPTAEIGYGTTDTWNDTGIHYKSGAPYFRIGADYNTMSKKKEKNSFLYVGLRYGISSFKYDVSTMPMDDPIWGDNIANPGLEDGIWGGSVPYDHTGMRATIQWFELVAGVKVQIYKSFSMGWALRMKYKMSASTNEYANPWYVPGFGKYNSSNIGVTYSLIYKLPY